MSKQKRVLVIAEAGVNHNGNLKLAKKLINIAKRSGADVVKFQTFDPSEIVTTYAKKAKYQNKYTKKKQTQYHMLKKLTLSPRAHNELNKYAKRKKIEFLSSSFDIRGLKMLIKLGIKRIKIPSGEITNLPLLKFVAKQKLPVILSTGMSNLKEVKQAIEILTKFGKAKSKITVLHCTSEYPAPIEEANLLAIKTIAQKLKVSVGYSDHTIGYVASIAAIVLGANVIEKHFTISRNLHGPDHKSSLEPNELKFFIESIRDLNKSFGNGKKITSKSEKKNKIFVRRSIVAIKKIKKGETFNLKNIGVKRPGSGISPMNFFKLIGKRSKKNYKLDEMIK